MALLDHYRPENQWKKIPKFSNYEINLRSQVRIIGSHSLLKPAVAVNNTKLYNMFDDAARLHLISEDILLVAAFVGFPDSEVFTDAEKN